MMRGDVCRDLFRSFDHSERIGIPSERVSLVPRTQDHVAVHEDGGVPGRRAYSDLRR